MDYLITVIFLVIWSFLWYKLGFLQAQIKEIDKDIRQISKNLEMLKTISDKNEEDIHRY